MLCRFAFLIFSHESLLIRLLVRCPDMLFPVRTPLYNLFAFVHPKVVSVFSKLSSQRIDGYNYFCYHISPFFVLLRIESVVSSRPFRDHPERDAYVRNPFPNVFRAPENFNFWEEEELRQLHELHSNEVVDLQFRRQRYVKHFPFSKFFRNFFIFFCIFFAFSRKIAKLHN